MAQSMNEILDRRNEFAYININKLEADGIVIKDYVLETVAMCEAASYEKGLVESRLLRAVIHLLDDELDEMLGILNQYTEDQIRALGSMKVQLIYYDIQMLYHSEFKGDYDRAIVFSKKEMAVAEAMEDHREIIRIKLNLATYLSRLDMEEASIEKLQEVLAMMAEKGTTDLMSYCLSNLAGSYLSLRQLKLAKDYATRAHKMALEENHHVIISVAVRTLASVEKQLGSYIEAIKLFQESIELGKEGSNPQDLYQIHSELQETYLLMEDYDGAYKHLDDMAAFLPYMESPWLQMDYYYQRSETLKGVGNMKEAFEALKQYFDLSDEQKAKGKTEDWMSIRASRKRNL